MADEAYYTAQFIHSLARINAEINYCMALIPASDMRDIIPDIVATSHRMTALLAKCSQRKCEQNRPEWCKDPHHPTSKCVDCPNFGVHFSDARDYCKLSLKAVPDGVE